jgi:hypothetical protein
MEPHDSTPEHVSSIGAIQWGALTAGTDGERIVLIVPAFFESHHVPYLTGVLEARLAELFDESVELELRPGRRTATRSGASYEPGEIVMSGVSKPWPDAIGLRRALGDAFDEAGEIEVQQMRLADELIQHLRASPAD